MTENKDFEIENKLIQVLSSGKYSYFEIAIVFNISIIKVRQFYHLNKVEYNFPKAPRSIIKPINTICWTQQKSTLVNHLEEAYEFYQGGLTLQEIGKRYGGISRERVRQIFVKYNLKTRSITDGCRRKYFHCEKGHPLGKGETLTACKTCAQDKREFRAKGLHFKTHCKYGHAKTPDNIYSYKLKNGIVSRHCKTCVRKKQKQYLERKKRDSSHK
jgi:hypothetical protein